MCPRRNLVLVASLCKTSMRFQLQLTNALFSRSEENGMVTMQILHRPDQGERNEWMDIETECLGAPVSRGARHRQRFCYVRAACNTAARLRRGRNANLGFRAVFGRLHGRA